MRSKILISCLLSAVIASGITAVDIYVNAAEENPQETSGQILNNTYNFTWDKSSDEGISVKMDSALDEVVLLKDNRLLATNLTNRDLIVDDGMVTIGAPILKKLDTGENILQLVTLKETVTLNVTVTDNTPTEDIPKGKVTIYAEKTEFDWERESGEDIIIVTNSGAEEFAVKNGVLIDSSLTNDSLKIDEGKITIGSDFLEKLRNGQNEVTIFLNDGKLNITINVLATDKELTAEQTDFVWDRSDLIGITVKTDSTSRNVDIMKDGKIIAQNNDIGVYIISGWVSISSDILKQLDNGENSLVLAFDDGSVPINITVTDKSNSGENIELHADKTEFEWERGSETGIVIQTNSTAKTFSVKKDDMLFDTSLTCKGLSIENGKISMGADFLNRLNDGENKLTLILKEGSIDISVNVKNNSSGSSDTEKVLSAEETYFIWDRSDLIGIAIKTNSKSLNVVITKDGKPLFSNKDTGVFVVLGRVGITSSNLKKLNDGENNLILEFDDGKLPVTINVTDRKNSSKASKELTAENKLFTWKRGSSEGINIKTNSDSENASVRRSGRLSLVSDEGSIYIKKGTVTLTPEYLETLPEGNNELTLILDDGTVDIVVNVIDTKASSITEDSSDGISDFGSSSASGLSGFIPATGNAALAAGSLIAVAAAAAGGVFFSVRKTKKKK